MSEQIAPYGSWRSAITAEVVAAGNLHFDDVKTHGATVYWIELRPQEAGRCVLMRRRGGDGANHPSEQLTPPGFSVRTSVHEYGGAAYLVLEEAGAESADTGQATVFFSNFADQRVYKHAPGCAPVPHTPEGYRYADGEADPRRHRLLYVREDHATPSRTPVNTLVAVDTRYGGPGEILVAGHDFYAAPRLSPAGDRLCWLAWSHPQMPWTATELWVATVLPDGTLTAARCVAGQAGDESIFQPQWSPDGVLYFVSDRTGWWNLYRWRDRVGRVSIPDVSIPDVSIPDASIPDTPAIEPIFPLDAEFGLPQWVFHMSTYAFVDAHTLACYYEQAGESHLACLDLTAGAGPARLRPLASPYRDLSNLRVAGHITGGKIIVFGGAPDRPTELAAIDPVTGAVTVIAATGKLPVGAEWLSTPHAIEFPTAHGLTAYGLYYPPHNPTYAAPTGDTPPLLVLSHGGPTAAVGPSLNWGIQFWTSHGFAVLDVNYGGSTGYGRDYRQRLNGMWGVVDVDDCANGAQYLVAQGLADPRRLIIRGGSAGGFTTLMALATRKTFAAGASYFGLSELESFAQDTHKFEARYLDSLVGPYPARRDLYRERSALTYLDGFNCPVIFFQGLEDKIVPPSQAEVMVEALRKKGLPVAYVTYPGEDHGFRQARNQIQSLENELYFYGRVLGFTPADELEPVHIENL